VREIETTPPATPPSTLQPPDAADDRAARATRATEPVDGGTSGGARRVEEIARPRRSRVVTMAGIAAAVVLGAWLAFYGLRRDPGGAVLGGPAQPTPSAPAAVDSVDAPLVRAPAATDPAPPATPSSASSPSVPTASSPSPRPHAVGPSPRAAEKARCTPPYTVDAAGTRHWKSGC